ncbi:MULTISPECIES: hypothetical protein [unclassified Pseudomonas]|uniref:hypothetical protein n=1 Tax=unclassified Pseudomonas TaxID=196821 RepID=UPI0014031EFC|nr:MULTISPECIES: hypothetical protein [unclassified Pseudomonas]
MLTRHLFQHPGKQLRRRLEHAESASEEDQSTGAYIGITCVEAWLTDVDLRLTDLAALV